MSTTGGPAEREMLLQALADRGWARCSSIGEKRSVDEALQVGVHYIAGQYRVVVTDILDKNRRQYEAPLPQTRQAIEIMAAELGSRPITESTSFRPIGAAAPV